MLPFSDITRISFENPMKFAIKMTTYVFIFVQIQLGEEVLKTFFKLLYLVSRATFSLDIVKKIFVSEPARLETDFA